MNEFVQTLNRELIEKYSLLNRKKATLKKSELILRTSYIELETPATKGKENVLRISLGIMRPRCIKDKFLIHR